MWALVVIGLADADRHSRLIVPLRTGTAPAFEMVTPIPHTALQQMFNGGSMALWAKVLKGSSQKRLRIGVPPIAEDQPSSPDCLARVATKSISRRVKADTIADDNSNGDVGRRWAFLDPLPHLGPYR